MAHRTATDCDWCGRRDVPKDEQIRINVKQVGAAMETPIGMKMEIQGELCLITGIHVCDPCAEKAEAAIRVWLREAPIYQVDARQREAP